MFDFFQRHFEVWKAAWEVEKEQRKKKRTYLEQDFLPAALAIMEKPASPVGRAIGWSILLFFTIAIVWAIVGRVEVVAVAPGRIIPTERVKVIQPADPGVVTAIYVRDGDYVLAGAPLVDLDPTFSGADEAEAKQALLAAEVNVARGEALLRYIMEEEDTAFRPPEGAPQSIVLMQRQMIRSRIAGYEAALSALKGQRNERAEDLQSAALQKASLEETLPLVKDQLDARETLLEKGLTPRFVYLELKERYLTQKASIEIQAIQMEKMKAAIFSINQQIEQLKHEFSQQVLVELAEATNEVVLRKEEYTKAHQRNAMQQLTSPVNGYVHQLAVNIEGAVVQAAQPVLVIVPEDEELVLEALISNKDIGFLKIGDEVTVKLETFPFTKYGTIHGKLVSLSTDAIEDENLGLVYQARIKLLEKTIRVEGREVALAPGMNATAEIKTGERRVIEFLLSPLLRYKDESLRER